MKKKIYLSNSFMTMLKKDHCPRQAYAAFVMKTKVAEPTIAMMKGLMFENLAFGLSEHFQVTAEQRAMMANLVLQESIPDLPEMSWAFKGFLQIRNQQDKFVSACHTLGYKMLPRIVFEDEFVYPELRHKNKQVLRTDTERLILQVFNFYKHAVALKAVFANVQKITSVPWHKDPDVILTIKTDFEGIIEDYTKQGSHPITIIGDLKLTGNVNSEWGDFSWGTPWMMDKSQAYLYTLVKRIETGAMSSFYYFVYDVAFSLGSKIIEVDFTKQEEMEINETIRKAVETYNKNDSEGWPEKTEYKRCQKCLLKDTCLAYQTQKPIPTILKA